MDSVAFSIRSPETRPRTGLYLPPARTEFERPVQEQEEVEEWQHSCEARSREEGNAQEERDQ